MSIYSPAISWFEKQNWTVYPFQQECWEAYLQGKSGILNAPTGSGKTYALILPILLEYLNNKNSNKTQQEGIQAIWIAPIRALTKEIQFAAQKVIEGLDLDWRVGIRSGDTSQADRKKQKDNPPQFFITTPESLHVLLSNSNYIDLFQNTKAFIVDEWHELVGSKRGVQVELALSRFKAICDDLKIWGISATIANLDEAKEVLLGINHDHNVLVRSSQTKRIAIESIIPTEIEKYPWAGHLGIQLLDQVLDIIQNSTSTLIFTNTRSQCEIWYQKLLKVCPDLSGRIAMHHGSIGKEIRDWVEDAIHQEKLKAVVCTSSLDLGVDFRPVESIIQIGSPKGVSRFVQRAGRSGHRPGAISKIYFLPTHSLELVEGAALRTAINEGIQEPRLPYIRSWDVLIQYLVTLSISKGFHPEEIYAEVKNTYCYESMSEEEWFWILTFIKTGGNTLHAYDEYQKVGVDSNGVYRIMNKHIALRHKLGIGTIVSDASLQVKYVRGKKIGTIEEWFIAQLKIGDAFWFAGLPLELVRVRDMTVSVRKSKRKTGKVPSWQGGRMPLSTMLAKMIRRKMYNYAEGVIDEYELEVLSTLFEEQRDKSVLPKDDEFMIEYFQTEEGYHLLLYPFEGRFVHEGIGALVAKRISDFQPISFSMAMNDYGLELLSEKKIDIDFVISKALFSTKDLLPDIYASLNSVEMARRRFREISKIAGLIFQGFPGQTKREKHLQSSSSLIFDVFADYDPENLLYKQAFEEVMTFQLEESRLREALDRIQNQKIILSKPSNYTPFSFPIIVDRLNRNKFSSESLADRVKSMIIE